MKRRRTILEADKIPHSRVEKKLCKIISKRGRKDMQFIKNE